MSADVSSLLEGLSIGDPKDEIVAGTNSFGDTIGQGAYSRVRRVESSNGALAVKIYNGKIAKHKIEKEAAFLAYVACLEDV
jgi:Ser/Thr protein kinase RdoA (MazF antagonist)